MIIGAQSTKALYCPVNKFKVPGPEAAVVTPGLPVTLVYACADIAAACSCRKSYVFIPKSSELFIIS